MRSLRKTSCSWLVPEIQNRPGVGSSVGEQGVVGVDGDRVADAREQRQVVERIAVEPAAFEVAPPETHRFEPVLDAGDLALAEGRGAAGFSGELAVFLCRNRGDQVRNAEFKADRAGDEAVGGGDDGAQVAGGQVFKHFSTTPIAEVIQVTGEFTWRVKRGESNRVVDYVAPPLMLSSEATSNDLNWSQGCYATPESIAAGLEQLYTDEALRQKLREAGPKRAAQFTWERSAEQLYAVYQEACRE